MLMLFVVGVLGVMGLGVVVAARGGRFTQEQPVRGQGYRDGGTKTVTVETPAGVRALGTATVVIGVFTAALLAPAGGFGALVLSDSSGSGVLLGIGAISGLILGGGIAFAGVWVARGERLPDVKRLAIAWGIHHAWMALFFVVWELDAETLLAAAIVLALGTAHAIALARAGSTMEALVKGSEPAPS
ncbi:MAG: hypothetical protein U0234_23015 [Sandaracinus sp.]